MLDPAINVSSASRIGGIGKEMHAHYQCQQSHGRWYTWIG
jgi:hypothetical protein